MALKTQKPNFGSSDINERVSVLISYVEELSDEIEFKFEILTRAVSKLRQICTGNSEGSEQK